MKLTSLWASSLSICRVGSSYKADLIVIIPNTTPTTSFMCQMYFFSRNLLQNIVSHIMKTVFSSYFFRSTIDTSKMFKPLYTTAIQRPCDSRNRILLFHKLKFISPFYFITSYFAGIVGPLCLRSCINQSFGRLGKLPGRGPPHGSAYSLILYGETSRKFPVLVSEHFNQP